MLNQFVNNGSDEQLLKSMVGDDIHVDQEELSKAMNKAGLVQKEVQVKGKNGKTFTRKQWVKASEDVKQPQQTNKSNDITGTDENDTVKYTQSTNAGNSTSNKKLSPRCKRNLNQALQSKEDFIDVRNEYNKEIDKKTIEMKSVGLSQLRRTTLKQEIEELKSELDYISKEVEEDDANIVKPKSKSNKDDINSKFSISKDEAKKKTQSITSKIGKTEKERNDFMSKVKSQGITWKENDNVGINWMRCCMAMNKYFEDGGSWNETNGTKKDSANSNNKNIEYKLTYVPKSGTGNRIKTVKNFEEAVKILNENGLLHPVEKDKLKKLFDKNKDGSRYFSSMGYTLDIGKREMTEGTSM